MAASAKIATEFLKDPLIWLFLASLAFVILQRRRLGSAPFPPGPKPLPVIGNMTLVDQLTHRGLAALAKHYGGLLHLRLGRLHVFAVSTPERSGEAVNLGELIFNLTVGVIFRAAFSTRDEDGLDEFLATLPEFSARGAALSINLSTGSSTST
uniref:Uncharacterized protein n=1 Tax=Aegilops tauschii TaxID=37682 RepID=M8CKI7_AEGTA